ncbi:elastase-1-like isoform X1 [Lethenteron reissneri]|uniref:elastase-1-like isoform X1 n=1 Tax=Lethenteron reissneri TaxID=7753 RepID=UPI002AB7CC58|nr:elastase-1-like isoform X1 [Lethenteron reissneri]
MGEGGRERVATRGLASERAGGGGGCSRGTTVHRRNIFQRLSERKMRTKNMLSLLLLLLASANLIAARDDEGITLPLDRKHRAIKFSPQQSRIVNGEEATPNSWPWQIRLYSYPDQSSAALGALGYACGGFLVNGDWVMTAAHCIRANNSEVVYLGKHDLRISESGQICLQGKNKYIHPSWNGDASNGFDIALVQLNESVQLTSKIQPASLPYPGQILANDAECYATGWGRLSFSGPAYDTLQQVRLPVVDYATCSGADWWSGWVRPSMICAGDSLHAVCKGDSGGPLNCNTSGGWVVQGITSFVFNRSCNMTNKPSVFTRLSDYSAWISSVTGMQFPTTKPSSSTTKMLVYAHLPLLLLLAQVFI